MSCKPTATWPGAARSATTCAGYASPRASSQEDLAEVAGMDRTYVGSVERGERNISLDNIWRLADSLGVDTSALLNK